MSIPDKNGGYNQAALDAASIELHAFFLREGSWYGTKACEEIGRMFMTAYLKAAPSAIGAPSKDAQEASRVVKRGHPVHFEAQNIMADEILRLSGALSDGGSHV